MNITALIPARGGSKRVPQKNLKPLGGRPLVEWTIAAALAATGISEVIVSTDDEDIAAIARQAGASVPWLRPPHLAADHSSIADVLAHFLDWCETDRSLPDGIMVLQPTSPFRRPALLDAAIDLYTGSGGSRSVIGVSDAGHSHPAWAFALQGEVIAPLNPAGLGHRSQELEKIFYVNGYVYLVSPAQIRDGGSLFSASCDPLIIEDRREALDIDTEWDWQLAEFLASRSA